MDPVQLAEQFGKSDQWQNLPGPVQTALTLGLLTFLPVLLMTLTAFTRIVIVLSFTRRAVTAQEIPPTPVLIGLALFLTYFVMGPTIDRVGEQAINPYLEGKIARPEAMSRAGTVLHEFLLHYTRRQDLALFIHLAGLETLKTPADTPFRVLIPAFIISELKTAFIMGFCISLPFLVVDLVVSSVLTAMGMVMMPPAVISAPIKVLLFVVADGWHLIARALSLSFN